VRGFPTDVGEYLLRGEIEVGVELQTRFEGGFGPDASDGDDQADQGRRRSGDTDDESATTTTQSRHAENLSSRDSRGADHRDRSDPA
jgi:hypothetical protein